MSANKDPILGALEELQKSPGPAGTPYIHPPDTGSVRDGTVCWRIDNRICGADCTAYNTEGIPGTQEVCHLLITQAQTSMALVTIARMLENQQPRRPAADMSPPPPKVGR